MCRGRTRSSTHGSWTSVPRSSRDGPSIARRTRTTGRTRLPNKKALIGSWVETVIFPPEFGRPPLLSLASYHEDHTFTHSDQGGVTLVPQEVYSSGRGIWRHVEGRVFEYTSRMLISDLSGNLIGQLKFRGTFTVSESGNEYSGTTIAQILDAGWDPSVRGRGDQHRGAHPVRRALTVRRRNRRPRSRRMQRSISRVGARSRSSPTYAAH